MILQTAWPWELADDPHGVRKLSARRVWLRRIKARLRPAKRSRRRSKLLCGDRLVSLRRRVLSLRPERPPGELVRHRTCCPCAAQSPAPADSWEHLAARLTRAVRRAKRSGHLWRQRVAGWQLLPGLWLMGLPPRAARCFQTAFDALFELDVRIACEASGQDHFMQRQPRPLQQMLSKPGAVLDRPDWLRAFLFQLWIGAHSASPPPALSEGLTLH